jgi:hypothetical protein
MIVTQERDTLRSGREELNVNFEELKRLCNALNENVNVMRVEHDAFQREKYEALENRIETMMDEQTGAYMFLTQEMELKSDTPRNTADLLKAAHECGKRLQFEVAVQKDELDWLLGRTVSSCMDTEENQVSHNIPSYCTM